MVNFNPTPLVSNSAFMALFRLEVLDPGGGFLTGYTFPLTPSSVKQTYVGMGNYWDVQSPPDTPGSGVTRQVDWFGNSLPVYSIEGTTGYQAHPTLAGGVASLVPGVTSAGILNAMINDFSVANAALIAQGSAALETMRFLDFYRSQFWQVCPLGEQSYSMDNQRPLYVNYRFRLVCVNDLSKAPLGADDPLGAVFAQGPAAAAAAAQGLINQIAAAENAVTNL